MDLFVFSPSSLRSSLFSLLVSGLIEWRTDKLSVVVNLPDFFIDYFLHGLCPLILDICRIRKYSDDLSDLRCL